MKFPIPRADAGLLILVCSMFAWACSSVVPLKPVGPLPSERQLNWQPLEYYAFIHFNMNTFTNMEWGLGGESPTQFNPSALDTRQWTRVAKAAGMKGIILTAKHHDGFCLWPSATTEHSVKNSAWKDGKGDVVKELAEACREFGLKFGVYLSPWDRNNKDYGKPEYVTVFHTQLRELLSNYGDIFEVWFDGANGGSGYYGGANETRKIDNKTYYDWATAIKIVRELQPRAVIFSDGGPDIRWVGNEEGRANETNWSIMRRDEIYPGWPRYLELRSGHEDGTHWLPAEADVSIRPGWYYHPSEDHQVKSLPRLLDIYYESVGRNAALLLNLPVDTRGLVHPTDEKQLMLLREQLDKDFASDLAAGQTLSVTNHRGNRAEFQAANLTDGDPGTYWATDEGVTAASITVAFDAPREINRLLLQEYIPLGQRVQEFKVEAGLDGSWKEIDKQTTVGYKRILRFKTRMADSLRVTILSAKGPPALSNLELYHAPVLLTEPVIRRDKQGMVSLTVPDNQVDIYYTLDGTDPTTNSTSYTAPFVVDKPAILKTLALDPKTGQVTGIVTRSFDVSKTGWKVLSVSSGDREEAAAVIDDDPDSFWASPEGVSGPHEITIELGSPFKLKGFTYWPMQERWSFGIITDYEFLVSLDNKAWRTVSRGEFSNVANNPVEQNISFNPTLARFIKLKAHKVSGQQNDNRASFGEIGIISTN